MIVFANFCLKFCALFQIALNLDLAVNCYIAIYLTSRLEKVVTFKVLLTDLWMIVALCFEFEENLR